jgi:cell division septum initiation protein DivIVA
MRLLLLFIVILSACNSSQQQKKEIEDTIKSLQTKLDSNQHKMDSVSAAIILKRDSIMKSSPKINHDSLSKVLIAEREKLVQPFLFKRVPLKAMLDSLEMELKKY